MCLELKLVWHFSKQECRGFLVIYASTVVAMHSVLFSVVQTLNVAALPCWCGGLNVHYLTKSSAY